jgi:hypothetical protein
MVNLNKIKVNDVYESFIKFIDEKLWDVEINPDVHYSIWYDIEEKKIFDVVEASSNWAFQDESKFICLLSISHGADFTVDNYNKKALEALGFEEWYSVYKEELSTILLEAGDEKDLCQLADKLIDALPEDTRDEHARAMFKEEVEHGWIADQFSSTIDHLRSQQEIPIK